MRIDKPKPIYMNIDRPEPKSLTRTEILFQDKINKEIEKSLDGKVIQYIKKGKKVYSAKL
jgi:hypothetical protein